MPVNKWLKTRKEKKEAEEREAVQAGLQRGEVRKRWSLGHRGAAGNQFREDLPKCLERKDTWKEKLNRRINKDWNSSAFKDTETLAEDKNLTMEIKTGNKQSAARPGELSFFLFSKISSKKSYALLPWHLCLSSWNGAYHFSIIPLQVKQPEPHRQTQHGYSVSFSTKCWKQHKGWH